MSNLTYDMRFNIEFAKEIEHHPCLYNKDHKEYNNKPSTDNAWRKIGKIFNKLSDLEIRLKYRSIRSAFVRSIRTQKEYYLAPYLDYLLPYVKNKLNEETTPKDELESEDENSIDSDEDCTLEIEKTKVEDDSDFDEYNGNIQVSALPELKLGQNNGEFTRSKGAQSKILVAQHTQYSASTLSPQKCYLKSILPDVSSMNERQFFNFRRGILNIIGKMKYSNEPPDMES